MIRFQWIDEPAFLLEAGGFRILSDPMLAEGQRAFVMNGHPSTGEDDVAIERFAPVPSLDLDGLDAVVVSHLQRLDRAAAGGTAQSPAGRLDAPGLQGT